MKKEIVNISAPIHQRLLNLSKEVKRPFNDLLFIYANERFLYRLSLSPYREKFVLKGAMAILNLNFEQPRFTRDIDFLGFTDNSVQNIERIVQEICDIQVEADGLIFDSASINGEIIKSSDENPGVRVFFNAYLGNAKIANLQVDTGIGDKVYPQINTTWYQGLLSLPQAEIKIYPLESILSEKILLLKNMGY